MHEDLPPAVKKELPEIGFCAAVELTKLIRVQRNRFNAPEWLAKARTLPKRKLQKEVQAALQGCPDSLCEIVCFRMAKSQLAVIERAIEVAARMLGTDRSRGYALEMIAADFLAGAGSQVPSLELLRFGLVRLLRLVPDDQRAELVQEAWSE